MSFPHFPFTPFFKMIATKTKPKSAQTNGHAPAILEISIPLSKIADSPYQLRVTHNEDLEGLRDTLLSHGLLQAIVVRPIARGHYELLAGHRRCAAARLAGWKEIRARVQEADDATAEEIVVVENLQRKDLSAIEEARGFGAMLKRGMTQEGLAQQLGVSQPHVANRIAYLKLPATWQEAIISGEIPHTYARALLPYCHDPRAAQAVAGVRGMAKPKNGETMSYEELAAELLWAFNRAGTQVHSGNSLYDKKTSHWIRLPDKLTKDQRAKLDILSVELHGPCGKRTHEIALNRSAWFEIARENHKRQETRNAARGNGKKPDKPRDEMTATERAAATAAEERNKKKRQEQLARHRREIAADRKRILIARALADPKRTGNEVVMLCMIQMTGEWRMDYRTGCNWEDVAQPIVGTRNLLERLADGDLAETKVWDVARAWAVRAFVDPETGDDPCPMSIVDEDYLDSMVAWLKIDLRAAWDQEQMGGLSHAWWDAHDKDQLATIGAGICVDMKKGEMVDTLTRSRGIDFPAELRTRAPRGRKKAK